MELGSAIKLMRTAAGFKQKDVASKLAVTSNYISLIEAGKREPSVALLRGLAKILGVPVGLFFLWADSDTRNARQDFGQLRAMLSRLEAMYLVANRQKTRKKRVAA
jgi:transcriptional regulator with XRE-family HTH domain